MPSHPHEHPVHAQKVAEEDEPAPVRSPSSLSVEVGVIQHTLSWAYRQTHTTTHHPPTNLSTHLSIHRYGLTHVGMTRILAASCTAPWSCSSSSYKGTSA